MRCLLLVMCASVMGCSGTVVLPRGADIAVMGTVPTPPRPRNVVYRDEVAAVVKGGLGRFLQHVDLRARLRKDDSGRDVFVGFEIVALRPASVWLSFDFAPGDVITHVNGGSVEHYNAVLPVFDALAEGERIDVSIIRGGVPTVVSVRIEPRTSRSASGRESASAGGATTASARKTDEAASK